MAASTPCFAVMGNPVAHSWSPWIHAQFALFYGVDVMYRRIHVETEQDGFERSVEDFFTQDGATGLNITVPFKERAYAYAQKNTSCIARSVDRFESYLKNHLAHVPGVSQRMRAGVVMGVHARAVNTLWRDAHFGCVALNTDGMGIIDVMSGFDVFAHSAPACRILVLGAGGTARSVVCSVLGERAWVVQICVANRTPERAHALVAQYRERVSATSSLRACALDELVDAHFDIIINTTSAGHSGKVPDLKGAVLSPGGYCFDLNYGESTQPFKEHCLHLGCAPDHFCDGLAMLVYQAHYAFSFWYGLDAGSDRGTLVLTDVVDGLRLKIEAGEQPPAHCIVRDGAYQERAD